MVDSGTASRIDLQIASLVQLQMESIGLGVNTFLVKRMLNIWITLEVLKLATGDQFPHLEGSS